MTLKYAPGSRTSKIGPVLEAWVEQRRDTFTAREANEAVAPYWTGDRIQLASSVRGLIRRMREAGTVICTGYTTVGVRTLCSYAPVSILSTEEMDEARSRKALPTGRTEEDGTGVQYACFGKVRLTSYKGRVTEAELADGDGWKHAVILKKDPRSNGTAWIPYENPCTKTVRTILASSTRHGHILIAAEDELAGIDVRRPYAHKFKTHQRWGH